MTSIPENHIEFCREVAKLCRKYGLNSFGGTYSPGYGDPWRGNIGFRWESGRHEADTGKVAIWSELRVNANIDVPAQKPDMGTT